MYKNVIIFSQNHWHSKLKYQRHHLAEFLSACPDVNKIFFFSKIPIRKCRAKDIADLFISIFGKKKKNDQGKNRKVPTKVVLKRPNLAPFQFPFTLFAGILRRNFIRSIKDMDLDWEQTLVISYQPFPELLTLKNTFREMCVVYISVHDYSTMPGVSRQVAMVESDVISEVDHFYTDSEIPWDSIEKDIEKKVLPPACPSDVVVESLRSCYISNRIKNMVYFGTISGYLDLESIIILKERGVNVDFMGEEHGVKLSKIGFLRGFKLLRPQDFEGAAKFLRKYDAVIMPYKNSERNRKIVPAKIYESFSLGIPVFAPDMLWARCPEFRDKVYIYNDVYDLVEKIIAFDKIKFVEEVRPAMLELASMNTWTKRFALFFDEVSNKKYGS